MFGKEVCLVRTFLRGKKNKKMRVLCLETHHIDWTVLKICKFMFIFRSCRVYNIKGRNCVANVKKMVLPPTQSTNTENNKSNDSSKDSVKPKLFRMFHDDTMRSFFRRLTFSPDGELLIVPAGLVEAESVTNATFVFTRNCFSKWVALMEKYCYLFFFILCSL